MSSLPSGRGLLVVVGIVVGTGLTVVGTLRNSDVKGLDVLVTKKSQKESPGNV